MAEGFVEVMGRVWEPLITKMRVGSGGGGRGAGVTVKGIVNAEVRVPLVPVITIVPDEPAAASAEADTRTLVEVADETFSVVGNVSVTPDGAV